MNYTGLSTKEANERLAQYGPNEITTTNKHTPLTIFLNQLKSPLIYILIFAAVISAALGEYNDAFFILLVVLVNSFLGFFQEYKAENTLEVLQASISQTVKVIRNSEKIIIPKKELVPGDLIVLESGLKVPGDGALIEATELTVNESLLTGESVPVKKIIKSEHHEDEENENIHLIFKGSTVIEGIGLAEITHTGDSTEFGQIAKNLSNEFDPVTPIKKELIQISKVITILVLLVSIGIFALGLFRGVEFEEIFLTTVALGVSTIPEGLIIALTITLALGMNRIMAKKAVVKNLPAAETLGDIDVLCVDKTGTLTYGKMAVAETSFTNEDLAFMALATSNNDANFIDKAISNFVREKKGDDYFYKHFQNRRKLFPFSSRRKYTGAFDGDHLFAVGAPEVILGFSKDYDTNIKNIIKSKAEEGYRMVAVAAKEADINGNPERDAFVDMTFLGLVFVSDPVRESVAGSIAKIEGAGIEIKVITGDLRETSMNILNKLNFKIREEEIIAGHEINEINNEEKFDQIVATTKLFYRTTPDQKLRIVKSLQKQNKRVGMMGDGVNDSPAIKKAEIGICVDSATDVTKEVADLVLLESDFQTIVDAVEEGRNIFENLRKIMTYLFADSLSETILITLSLILGLPLPLLPLQLLWINLVEDGLASLALSFDKSQMDLLKQPPRKQDSSIFDRQVISLIVIISLIIDVIYFIIFKHLLDTGYSLERAQTFIFFGVAVSSLVFLYSAKTVDSNIWRENIFDNIVVNLSVVVGFILMLLSVYWGPLQELLGTVSLTRAEVGYILLLALADTMLIEIVKYFAHKLNKTLHY
ncbi:cation-transporting P-type ATPase [Candidatus Dojkabacteria bacterium]|uniref:Cation-transporting P-type ATPase n=1 Tax=Candidatus Dojkabacteria bacterium TaxID=2099670 RepID=A0A955L5V7_9BACT|nr:cation-transporting P-type ATPase [Candidatus Dojkabacteria bacterium]